MNISVILGILLATKTISLEQAKNLREEFNSGTTSDDLKAMWSKAVAALDKTSEASKNVVWAKDFFKK